MAVFSVLKYVNQIMYIYLVYKLRIRPGASLFFITAIFLHTVFH